MFVNSSMITSLIEFLESFVPTATVYATPVQPTPSPRPPDLYDTAEAALERATELGCSG